MVTSVEELLIARKVTFEQIERLQKIIDAIDAQLIYEPALETRNRKRMRPNPYAEWELRSGDFRVLYNVDDQVHIVEIERVGEKRGDAFYFRGQEEDI